MFNFFLFVALVLAAFSVYVTSRPDDFSVTRSATLQAPANVLFEQVNDLQKWGAWSPWARMDPDAKYTFEGPQAGVGAVTKWEGNEKVGSGIMTITESTPFERVAYRLEFLKPFEAVSASEFKFQPEANGTKVTWTMSGKNNFMAKAMSLIMNCDKMVGDQFEAGLANLAEVTKQ